MRKRPPEDLLEGFWLNGVKYATEEALRQRLAFDERCRARRRRIEERQA